MTMFITISIVIAATIMLFCCIYIAKHPNTSSSKRPRPLKRKQSHENDNMNCNKYMFSAKYIKTNRMHRDHIVYIFNDEDVRQRIEDLGYTDPIEFYNVDFPIPSEAQLDYLHDLMQAPVPDHICSRDAGALIDFYLYEDDEANQELFEYATEMHIPVSYYCRDKRLYNTIFYNLALRDKIAFFIFSVYKYKYHSHLYTPWGCQYEFLFYEFADIHQENKRFITSMNRYDGADLQFFGIRDGCEGGSKATIAYKTALEFLKQNID